MQPAEASDEKRMRLRYAGSCRICGIDLPARHEAIWERASKTVRCVQCQPPGDAVTRWSDGQIQPAPFESGVAGASARREYERRVARREERIRASRPRLAGVILRWSHEPQSTKTWASGARGEAALGAKLDKKKSDSVAVLHDRRIPRTRANIDHIVVTAGTVFVVDAKRYVNKRPALRVTGGLLRRRVEKLIVGGRDRTRLVDGVLAQVERVRAALGEECVDVQGVLCFVDADWPMFGAFFSSRGVRVVSPRKLVKLIDGEGGDTDDVRRVRDRLAQAFPVA